MGLFQERLCVKEDFKKCFVESTESAQQRSGKNSRAAEHELTKPCHLLKQSKL